MFCGKRLTMMLLLLLIMAIGGSLQASSPAQRDSNGILVLMTDWGTRDFFVGAVKGVAYSIFPEVTLVDLTHDIEPYNLMEGANTLLLAAREYPAGTTFVAVVDPGVGTERRPLAMETSCGRFFIAPDNGLLTLTGNEFGIEAVYHIENEEYMRPGEISYTFHGRDIFIPAGAHIAAGRPISRVGPQITDYEMMDFDPPRVDDAVLEGQIVHSNVYGNLQTNITRNTLAKMGWNWGDTVHITIGDITQEAKFVYTYGDVPQGDNLIYISSTDFVSIAVNMGNAAQRFDAHLQATVYIEKKE